MSKLKTGCVIAAMCLTMFVAPVSTAFDFDDVTRIAQETAAKPHVAPPTIPDSLTKLSYDQFRQVRFDPARSLWHESSTNFQVMLMAPGLLYRHTVDINIIDGNGTHQVPFYKDWFSWPGDLATKVPDDLGYAGLKLTFPLNAPDLQNQFLVFAGASYFRGVARDQRFGISTRGIAVDTGLASGEEFPSFTRFWLVRPSPDAKAMRLYALLDGPSLSGAYQFVIHPGEPLRMEVKARLFFRKDIKLLGLAPLTSMFQYGANTPRPLGAWRPAVHDSDGLLVHAQTGEWLWRPLINPLALESSFLQADSPLGFGLMQRHTQFADFQDSEARYELRPSTWVKPEGDWGKGHVVLVEIPTRSEVNDNIVAFWSPKDKPRAGDSLDLAYTLKFGWPSIADEPMAHVVATHVGRDATGDADKDAYRMVVDFAGWSLPELDAQPPIQAVVSGLDGAQVLHKSVHAIADQSMWRLSMLVKPPKDKPLRVRAFLSQEQKTLSETWTYVLPIDNKFNPND